jgi:hypothetical protein
MEFNVNGSDITYDLFGCFGGQSWILDLTINEYFDWTTPYEFKMLTDGHRYKAGMRSELYCLPLQYQEEEQSSELHFFNAEIIRKVPEPTAILLLGTGLATLIAVHKKKKT